MLELGSQRKQNWEDRHSQEKILATTVGFCRKRGVNSSFTKLGRIKKVIRNSANPRKDRIISYIFNFRGD